MDPDYSHMNVNELKQECRKRGLATTKEELVAKLKVSDASTATVRQGKRGADVNIERVDVSSFMRSAKAAKTEDRVFGLPDGGGPESALGDRYSFAGHPSAQRFCVGERVILGTDEWTVKKSK